MNESSESPDEAEQRNRRFWQVRGIVPGQNPALARLKALARRDEMARASRRMQPAQLNFNSYLWQCIGPSPLTVYQGANLSGRVPAIAVDPTNPNNVFIGAADGGVWKSTNGGATWIPLTDNQPSLAIGALAIDPLNPNIIFAGTGEPFPANQFTYSAGLLMSTDAGATWTNIQQPFLQGGFVSYEPSQIAVDPQNDQIVLAASPNGALLSSSDGGLTWTIAAQGEFDAVVFDPNKRGLVYAGVIGSSGYPQVWSSKDAGATWSQATVDTIGGSRVVMAVGPDSTLYVGIGSNQANLYKSTDGGQTFTQLNNMNNYPENLCTAQCTYNLAIAVSPKNPSEIWFGGQWLNRSLDGGQTWEMDYGNYHADQHAIVFSASGDRVYFGNDGGVYEANPPEQPPNTSLLDLNNGLATLQFYQGISMAPGNLATGVGGMQDNGTALYNGSQWSFVLNGDSFATAIDPANLNTIYSTTIWDNIYRSTTGGGLLTFSSFMNGLPQASVLYTTLVLDNTDPNRLYTFSGGQFYRTVDSSGVWQQASSLPSETPAPLAITISPIDDNVIWVAVAAQTLGGTGGYVSQNAAGLAVPTWTTVPVTFQRAVTRIAPDPLALSVGYGAISGYAFFSNDNAGHVIRFDQYGTSSGLIGTGLPDVPANDIVADPGLPNTLYVATDIGVFMTSDGGTSWIPMNKGLPNVIVTGLLLDNQTRTLRAGTHGRSIWQTTLPPALIFRTSVSSLIFATSGIGSVSPPQTLLILNSSPGPISLTVSISGPFNATNSCGGQLSAGQYCTYSVTFTATANGTATGSLQLTEASSGYSSAIALSGSAAALLVPASTNFGSVDLGSAADQAVTLTNPASSPITITSLTPSGDFHLGASSCVGITLQPAKVCNQNVVFSPTAAGGRNGMLVVSDSLDTASQTVSLSGMGSDFSLALASSQLSVKAGASNSVGVNVTSSTNFTGSIVFSCSGLPTGITCSFSPKSALLASGAADTTLSIAAANTVAYVSPAGGVDRRLSLIFALSIPGIFLVSNKRRRSYLYLMLPFLLMLSLMLGCQGVVPTQSAVGPTGTTNPPGSPGSNPSIVNVTITAQAGTLQHSATLSVSVQ
jgi:photosystem II stability/assembly factor-like uncharacterized protein